ncbi:MAG: hypothetical protein RIM23_24535 [Coleofasciculus sp. G3-WIS-01]|uniref:hypothetical protein n=1 Tax=Coleofasciculus sp. G3-WIS-01 TaxID=3069528 RepID=UPI0032F1B619
MRNETQAVNLKDIGGLIGRGSLCYTVLASAVIKVPLLKGDLGGSHRLVETIDNHHIYDVKQDNSQVFRRITVSPGEQLRTATERLSLLDLAGISGLAPLTLPEFVYSR